MRATAVRAWLLEAGLPEVASAAELSRKLGCTRDHAWQMAGGRRVPQGVTLGRYAELLGVPAGRLLEACLAARKRYELRKAARLARELAERSP